MTNGAAGAALPLDEEQSARVEQAITGLSPQQLQWVSGYIAGIAASANDAVTPAAESGNTLAVLYGSQTGNGQAVAETVAARARLQGFAVRLESLADYKPAALKREAFLVVVVSTHGEGDPPDDAELFHDYLLSASAPKLAGLKYTVLALGDSSYVNFCQTGREFDQRLAELGAERLLPVVECDLDYDAAAAAWTENLLEQLPDDLSAGSRGPQLHAVAAPAPFDKSRPFPATVLVNQKITGRDSSRDIRHIELAIEGSGLRYEPGDALAVVTPNPPQLVDELLDELGLDAEDVVSVDGSDTTLGQALGNSLEITAPSLKFLRAWADACGAAELIALFEPGKKDALARFMATHQVIDIVRRFPVAIGAAAFAASLRALLPRAYSIASSQRANPDEVHLTVAAVRYRAFGTEHWGAASTHLADRVTAGDTVDVYVEPNPRFRLPDDDKPIIMIGPGTGVAPFRAFIEERIERNATGKNWLFFGARNFSTDFLYQLEWQRYLKRGDLQRLDVAFSRDLQEKIYVQHRLIERGKDVFRWLAQDARIYVCGDASRMAGDVDRALVEILATHGGRDRDAAEAELRDWRRAGRYQRDVY